MHRFHPRALLRLPFAWLVAGLLFTSLAHAAAPATTRQAARFEVTFMQKMIDHHSMAVEMSMTCQTKAVHEELATLCGEMRQAQLEEIATMQAWLESWYGISYAPEIANRDQRRMERMSSLSSAAYEIEFMQTMIEHHSVAIEHSTECLQQAVHAPLLEMCENMIVMQAMEIRQMRTWLCDWYQVCSPRRER
jgi:uncharacterized protein (DUF305 family)